MKARFRPAGGAFGPVQPLSEEGNSLFPFEAIVDPRAALNGDGDALVAWTRDPEGQNRGERIGAAGP